MLCLKSFCVVSVCISVCVSLMQLYYCLMIPGAGAPWPLAEFVEMVQGTNQKGGEVQSKLVWLLHFEGSRPEWCISSMIYYIVKIHHSGRKPSICFMVA